MSGKWDKYFMAMAEHAATLSKDMSTQNGCVIVGPDRDVLSTGFNGMPMGVNDDVLERHERPLKYKFIEHAERNAIYLAARRGTRLKGATLYCTWPPCTDCARAIIQAGIVEVVVKTTDVPERWHEDMIIHAAGMMREAGVKLKSLEGK